ATDGISKANLIGTGGVSFVYKGMFDNNDDDSLVAVKVWHLQNQDMVAHVGGFGLARLLGTYSNQNIPTGVKGTIGYAPPVETCTVVGIKSLLNIVSITAALIDVNVAQSKLVLLENFNGNYSKCLRLLYKVNVAEGVNVASEEVSTAELVIEYNVSTSIGYDVSSSLSNTACSAYLRASLEVFNDEFSRLSKMDDDLFTYEVEVANIPCDSKMDNDSEQEADDDMGYDPSDIRGDDEVELTDEESSDDENDIAEDYEWYEALENCKLKDEALRNKAIMEGSIKEDDEESHYKQKRQWNTYTNYDDAYEINHEQYGISRMLFNFVIESVFPYINTAYQDRNALVLPIFYT
ncbi:zf-BED domain-containing protein, partial [Tanacetum coccineum]